MGLTDAQWVVISPLLSNGKSGQGRVGRPRRDNRRVTEGILWILRTGARWKDLPSEFPPYQTCYLSGGVDQPEIPFVWTPGEVVPNRHGI